MILVSQHVFPAAHYGPLEKKREKGEYSTFLIVWLLALLSVALFRYMFQSYF